MTFDEFVQLNRRVDAHRFSRGEWLDRHRRVCDVAPAFGRRGIREVAGHVLVRVSDDRNAVLAIEHLIGEGGSAAGPPGGHTLADVAGDRFRCADAMRDQIRAGTYRHGPTNVVWLPKRSGTGRRPVHLLDVEDRVVHRMVVQVLGPLLDVQLDPLSFGGRPGRTRLHALAAVERYAAAGRRTLVTADIADAFQAVPQQRLLQILNKFVPVQNRDAVQYASYRLPTSQERPERQPVHETLQGLVSKLVVTEERVGLRQGAATSTMFFNAYRHHVLDRPWRRTRGDAPAPPPLVSWVDDLLLACDSLEEAEDALRALRTVLLPTGMKLKEPKRGERAIHDLEEDVEGGVRWLGYRIGWRDGALWVRPDPKSWDRLYERFEEVASRRETSPQGYVTSVALSWAREMGPAYEHVPRPRCHWGIARIARRFDLPGMPDLQRFEQAWLDGRRAWETLRRCNPGVRLSRPARGAGALVSAGT
jgi:hypothetical protein